MSLWDDVKSNIADWYNVTSVKTAELGRIGVKSYDKFGISREIERQFSELGSFVYAGLKEEREDLLESQTVRDLIARIQGLETELREKDEEIDGIRKEAAERRQTTDEEAGDETEAATADVPPAATVITDPVLEEGSQESAILVEPEQAEENLPEDKRI